MTSSPYILNSILTSKVNVGYAPKLWSDSRQTEELMMCPMWHGFDMTGREAHEDTFYTKNEGCHSALDRITVENQQRPQAASYIFLDVDGFRGDLYSGTVSAEQQKAELAKMRTPQFGNISGRFNPTHTDLAAVSEANRNSQRNYMGSKTQGNMAASGSGSSYRFMHGL